jgi:wobble nucleotide-excising tRNase
VPMLNKNFCWCVSSSNTMLLWSSTVKFTSGRQCSVLLRNMMGRKLVLYYSEFVITATGMQYGMGPGMTDP